MDPIERAHLYLKVMTGVSLAMLVVGAVGEVLGWWNDVGTVLMTMGSVGSVVGVPVTLWWGSSKRQVHRIAASMLATHSAVGTLGERLGAKLDAHTLLLERQTGMLERQTGMLERQTGMLERQTGMLERQTGMLERHGGALDRLGGAQGEQVELLRAIRDRLGSHA